MTKTYPFHQQHVINHFLIDGGVVYQPFELATLSVGSLTCQHKALDLTRVSEEAVLLS